MAKPPDEPQPAGEWTELKDGQVVGEGPKRERDVAPRVIVALVALLAALIFISQNRNRVKTSFLFFDGHPRLWVVIVASVLLGALLGQAAGLLLRRRKDGKKGD